MLTRLAVIAAASLVLPTAAQASEITSDGTTARFHSAGDPADVQIFTAFGPPGGLNIQLTDLRGDVDAGAGCTAGSPILCAGSRLDIALNGGSDRSISSGDASEVVSGGGGNDIISSSAQDTGVSGGSGDDVIRVNANQNSQAHGDGGNDVIWGLENFPALYGDSGADFLFGDGLANHLDGGIGDDQIVGAARRFRGGTIEGGSGSDAIAFLAAANPGSDPWTIDAGEGPDTVIGSKSVDTIDGGAGADQIDVTGDGQADSVTCGIGRDRVYADPGDVVAADCEAVSTSPMPASPRVVSALNRAANIAAELQPLLYGPR